MEGGFLDELELPLKRGVAGEGEGVQGLEFSFRINYKNTKLLYLMEILSSSQAHPPFNCSRDKTGQRKHPRSCVKIRIRKKLI